MQIDNSFVEIREATIDDMVYISEINMSSWIDSYGGIISSDYLENLVNRKEEIIKNFETTFDDKNYLVAVYNGEIVGYLEYELSNKYSLDLSIDSEICSLYVKKEYRNLGIGSKLFSFSVDIFKKNGKSKIGLWCIKDNDLAISFYMKKGGEIIKETDFTLDGDNNKYKMIAIIIDL